MNISQKGQKRYDSFIEVGLELFLQNGYEGTSLNDIVSKSGGSLASIYKFFNNKEGLFVAILNKKFENFRKELDKNVNLKNVDSLHEFLVRFGITYIEIFYRPETVSFSRIIISEAYKNRELGKIFFDNIVLKTVSILIDFFNKDDIKPLLKNLELLNTTESYNDTEFLAYKFCALIREPFFTHALLLGENTIKNISKKKKETMIVSIVDSFLYGIVNR